MRQPTVPDCLIKMKRDVPMRKLMIKYCELMGYGDYHQFRFIFNGRLVKEGDTPNSLELKNGDSIEALPVGKPPNCSI